MKNILVVHLVRANNGIETFKRFLDSYHQYPGGVEHDLLIVFKGFGDFQSTKEYKTLLAPFQHLTLEISDEGFDITAYFAAVWCYSEQYRYFCFLNSYSVIQADEWLRKLHDNITKSGVGLAGASGSWNSHHSNVFNWFITFGGVVHYQSPTKKLANIENRPWWKKVISRIKEVPVNTSFLIHFNAFPNYHLRTNAFMISGEDMLSLKCPVMRTKMDAYKFEGGKHGLTMQMLKKGKRVIVVGKDGAGYEKEAWNNSKTFWRFGQENLMVADNQTRDYQEGTVERRNHLASLAWDQEKD